MYCANNEWWCSNVMRTEDDTFVELCYQVTSLLVSWQSQTESGAFDSEATQAALAGENVSSWWAPPSTSNALASDDASARQATAPAPAPAAHTLPTDILRLLCCAPLRALNRRLFALLPKYTQHTISCFYWLLAARPDCVNQVSNRISYRVH